MHTQEIVYDEIICKRKRIKTFCTTPTAACNGVKQEYGSWLTKIAYQ